MTVSRHSDCFSITGQLHYLWCHAILRSWHSCVLWGAWACVSSAHPASASIPRLRLCGRLAMSGRPCHSLCPAVPRLCMCSAAPLPCSLLWHPVTSSCMPCSCPPPCARCRSVTGLGWGCVCVLWLNFAYSQFVLCIFGWLSYSASKTGGNSWCRGSGNLCFGGGVNNEGEMEDVQNDVRNPAISPAFFFAASFSSSADCGVPPPWPAAVTCLCCLCLSHPLRAPRAVPCIAHVTRHFRADLASVARVMKPPGSNRSGRLGRYSVSFLDFQYHSPTPCAESPANGHREYGAGLQTSPLQPFTLHPQYAPPSPSPQPFLLPAPPSPPQVMLSPPVERPHAFCPLPPSGLLLTTQHHWGGGGGCPHHSAPPPPPGPPTPPPPPK